MQRSYTNRQIWALLIPLIAESVLTCLMGTVDAMMVSNAGADAISAVSLVDTLNILIVQVFTALATGGTVICAQLLGRGDRAEAVESAKQLQLAVCSAAALLAAIAIVLHGPLLRLLFGSVEDSVMQGCRTYFVVTALSFPFLALYSGGAGIYRSCGNSRLPMTLSLISNGMNVIGNAVLIFGFHMGVLGVAIPTLVSRMFSGIAIMLLLRRPGQPLTLRHWRGLRFSWPRIGRMMRIGVPNGIENGMFQFGKLIIQSTISAMGTTAIAANAITTQL